MYGPIDDRRCKILYVPARVILGMVFQEGREVVRLQRVAGIPSDYRVVNVNWDFCRDAFGILIEHPSFDPVPLGGEYPALNSISSFEEVIIPLKADEPMPTWESESLRLMSSDPSVSDAELTRAVEFLSGLPGAHAPTPGHTPGEETSKPKIPWEFLGPPL